MPPLVRCRAGNAKSPMTSGGGHGALRTLRGGGLGLVAIVPGCRGAVAPGAAARARGLEVAELGQPREAGEVPARAQLGTFHAVMARLLIEDGAGLPGLPRGFAILGQNDARELLMQAGGIRDLKGPACCRRPCRCSRMAW